MKIQFLGTAAAEAAPAVFCACDHCRYAREKGGKEIRTRSGALIDGKIKIDFGPDSYAHSLQYGLDYSLLHSVLITHTHEDHLNVDDLTLRRPPFGHLRPGDGPMTVYGNARLGEMLAPHISDCTKFQRMIPFETVDIEGYQVTALEAVHFLKNGEEKKYPVIHEGQEYYRAEEALFYLIEKDGESILYAHDTDEFTPADMDFLAGKKIDLISLDCTNGKLNLDYVGHMGARENLRMREKLMQNGAADEHTIFVANHFSHNGLLPYEELEKLVPGFIVSYDGLILETKK